MCFTGNSRRAVGLAEVMIGATLLLLVSGLALKALQFAGRYHKRVEAQQALTEKALTVASRLEAEMAESNIGLIHLDPDHGSLSFLLPRDENNQITTVPESGELVWSSASCYTLENDGRILKKQRPITDPSTTPENPLTLGMDGDFFGALPATQMLADKCVSFQFEFADRLGYVGSTSDGTAAGYSPPAPVAGQPEPTDEPAVVDIRLKLQEKGDRTYGVTIQTSCYPRN